MELHNPPREATMTATMKEFTPRQIEVSSRQLTRLRWRREIDRAHRGGEEPADIADRLGGSLKEIETEIRTLENRPNQLVRKPMEVIDEYVVGERSREELIHTLSTWPHTFGDLGVTPGTHPMSSDAWNRGTWDDVKYAETRGLIDEDAFKQIARAADLPAAVFPQWVNGSTHTKPAA